MTGKEAMNALQRHTPVMYEGKEYEVCQVIYRLEENKIVVSVGVGNKKHEYIVDSAKVTLKE